jgi:hypothetical protein
LVADLEHLAPGQHNQAADLATLELVDEVIGHRHRRVSSGEQANYAGTPARIPPSARDQHE